MLHSSPNDPPRILQYCLANVLFCLLVFIPSVVSYHQQDESLVNCRSGCEEERRVNGNQWLLAFPGCSSLLLWGFEASRTNRSSLPRWQLNRMPGQEPLRTRNLNSVSVVIPSRHSRPPPPLDTKQGPNSPRADADRA